MTRTYRTASGLETHRIPVEFTFEEAEALARLADNFEGADGPFATALRRVRKQLAVEAPEWQDEPEWARG